MDICLMVKHNLPHPAQTHYMFFYIYFFLFVFYRETSIHISPPQSPACQLHTHTWHVCSVLQRRQISCQIRQKSTSVIVPSEKPMEWSSHLTGADSDRGLLRDVNKSLHFLCRSISSPFHLSWLSLTHQRTALTHRTNLNTVQLFSDQRLDT